MKKHVQNYIARWKHTEIKDKIIIGISLIYLCVVSIFMMWHQSWVSPDNFLLFAFVAALLIGRVKSFIWDWVPVVFLFLGYEYLRGLIPFFNKTVNIFPMIDFDKKIFGTLPTIELQKYLSIGNSVHWYDYIAVILYMSHFIMPMLIGFFFWIKDRQYFKNFMIAFIILSYITFLTYLLYPAMPPWMAAEQGFIPPIKKINDEVFGIFTSPIVLPTIYQFFGANLVAAVPSLHAAFPWLIFLFVIKKIKYYGLFLSPYVFGVWFSVVYLGEHYVFDVILGILYATLAFIVVIRARTIQLKVKSLIKTLHSTNNFEVVEVETE